MSVIEYKPIANDQSLNGLFSFIGRKKRIENANRQAINTIDDIKSENGFNDLMYMKPEQAARTLNKIIEQLAYYEAKEDAKLKRYRASDSIAQAQRNKVAFSSASGEVMSQFRQYALGMNGEVQKLGSNKKKIDGFEFTTPFYKMVLPQKAQGTNPVDGVSKDELLSILKNQKHTSTAATNVQPKDNMALYIGLGVGALAVTGGIIYALKKK